MKAITLRTSSGTVKGSITLTAWKNCGNRPTHNGDGLYTRCVGVDAAGIAYHTTRGQGWRVCADPSTAEAIRGMVAGGAQ
jgi:hypothetical protein